MKKVYLHSYCRNNVGDDLFVLTMAERYPHVEFHVPAVDDYKSVFSKTKNIVPLSDFDEYSIKNRLKLRFCYKAFVKLGGSIFMEPLDWEKQPPFPKWQSLILGGNKFIIGANFGPFYTDEFFLRAESSLKYYKSVSFRDKYSKNLFGELKNCSCFPDILFGYPHYPERKKGFGVGISVIKMEERNFLKEHSEEYYKAIADSCISFLNQNIPVKLFSFCEKEGDEEAIQKVLSSLDEEKRAKISLVLYSGNVSEILDELNSCEYIAATRFHAMVIGFSLGKKVYPIIYSKKMSNVLDDISFSGKRYDVLGGDKKTGDLIATEILSSEVFENIECLKKESQNHFMAFDKFIK